MAGGEFLIPTFVLLFGADIKLASSLSLAVSLPTMLVGLTALNLLPSIATLASLNSSRRSRRRLNCTRLRYP